ncbi:MAG: hypothetical protein IKS90_02895 [Clostridia bacterium]|nr:hypothetical protein [Clostridia bacterium]
MALKTYEIPYFVGLNQASDENRLDAVYSPDAVNMSTDGGALKVAAGFEKYIGSKLPGNAKIDLLTCMRTPDGDIPVAISGGRLYIQQQDGWTLKYTYPSAGKAKYDAALVKIDTSDYLVIADGRGQMIKLGDEATPFGSAAGCSDIPVSYLTVYRGRLFSAGDAQNPNRLYYSVLPGGGRTVEDWGYVEASPSVEGGFVEVGASSGDAIVAIKALSNQLLIFKKHGLYRLIGDRPSNFTIEHIDANVPKTHSGAIALYGDTLYFVTQDGLYYYNGVTARPCPDMRCIRRYMSEADIDGCRAVTVRDKLYFTYRRGGEDEMMVYDLTERKYMRRNGFEIDCIADMDGRLLLINRTRRLYEFEKGDTYDGNPIEAYWCTPLTDLGDKASIKALKMLFMRARGDGITIETELDGIKNTTRVRLDEVSRVKEVPLFNEGRVMRIKLSNLRGGFFALEGGVETELGIRRRTE